ncbi:MAG: hypothetical protein HY536_01395, partial [Candidatus Colwellbacteria bacterium]|nr:hypothetical protein [Candidatus Colwellbacteria bacterium]
MWYTYETRRHARQRAMRGEKTIRYGAAGSAIFVSIVLITAVAYAWTNPSQNPPGGGGVLSVSSGNAGIGTAAPADLLEVSGVSSYFRLSANAPTLRLNELDTTNTNFQIGVNGGKLLIETNNDAFSSLSTKLVVDQSGNVGVGAMTPAARLHIAHTTGGILVDSGSTNAQAIKLTSSGTGWGSGIVLENTTGGARSYGFYSGSDGKLHVADVGAGADRIVVGAAGEVGIGTVSPGEKLDVAGNIRASGVIKPGISASAPVTCDAASRSSIYFNDTDKRVYYCNGAEWRLLGANLIFGDGSDGDLNTTGNVTYAVPQEDVSVVVKQYRSIRVNAGHTLKVDRRTRGLFLYSQGDVVIDGAIDLSGKAAHADPQSEQLVIAMNLDDGLLQLGKVWDASKQNRFFVAGPSGRGGKGGAGGVAFGRASTGGGADEVARLFALGGAGGEALPWGGG